MTDKTETVENNEATEGQEQGGTGLSLLDLKNVVVIIDLAAERGTWKGPELGQIAAVREKYVALVQALTPKEATEAAPEGDVAAEEAEAAPEAAAQ